MLNISNGYYSGWLEVETTYEYNPTHNRTIFNNNNLIIVVGLPASGKTTYCINNFPDYKMYDDFIKNFYNNNLIDKLKNNINKKIIINDPRLCDPRIFIKYIKIFLNYVSLSKIKFIFFENAPEKCITNSKKRNEKKDTNLMNTILNYSNIYRIDEIKNFINYIYKNLSMKKVIKFEPVYN